MPRRHLRTPIPGLTEGTATVLPGETGSVTLTAPVVSDLYVLRVTATFASPTQAFPEFSKQIGMAVVPPTTE
jgi:hypothetical protein